MKDTRCHRILRSRFIPSRRSVNREALLTTSKTMSPRRSRHLIISTRLSTSPENTKGVVSPHAIIVDLGDVPDGEPVTLFLTGWIFPTDTSINVSLFQNLQINPAFPYLQVRNSMGEWETVIDIIGLPAGKNKTIAIDLTGKFLSDDRRVKIATDMQIYWDAAFFSVGEDSDVPIRVTELSADRADLHYRGFSKMYRPTPHAPHLFDYDEVETTGQWRDLQGYYTRFGDVTPLLQDVDDMYVIMNAGDEMTVEFDADKLPPLQDGWERSFILYSDGWDKDGDINTLHSQTVEPLPFHGMSAYPYPDNESYPNGPRALAPSIGIQHAARESRFTGVRVNGTFASCRVGIAKSPISHLTAPPIARYPVLVGWALPTNRLLPCSCRVRTAHLPPLDIICALFSTSQSASRGKTGILAQAPVSPQKSSKGFGRFRRCITFRRMGDPIRGQGLGRHPSFR